MAGVAVIALLLHGLLVPDYYVYDRSSWLPLLVHDHDGPPDTWMKSAVELCGGIPSPGPLRAHWCFSDLDKTVADWTVERIVVYGPSFLTQLQREEFNYGVSVEHTVVFTDGTRTEIALVAHRNGSAFGPLAVQAGGSPPIEARW